MNKCHSQTIPSLKVINGGNQGQETILTPSADKQTHNYDTECSIHHPS